MATDWQIMDSIGIYDRANDTVLNEEIYNSLEYLTPNRENYLVGSPKIRKYATDGTFVDYNIASVAPYNVTVPTGWTTDSAGRYYKTVTVNGLLATDTPVADVVLGTDRAANRLYRQAWGNVTDIQTAANAITFYADDTAPTTAMTVQLQVVR